MRPKGPVLVAQDARTRSYGRRRWQFQMNRPFSLFFDPLLLSFQVEIASHSEAHIRFMIIFWWSRNSLGLASFTLDAQSTDTFPQSALYDPVRTGRKTLSGS